MFLLILSLLLFPTVPVQSQVKKGKLEKIAFKFFQSGNVFSAAYFVNLHLNAGRPWSDRMEKLLLQVYLQTGSLSFVNLKDSVVKRYQNQSPTVRFIFGMKFFKEKRYVESIKLLRKIPDSHILAAEKFFILGAAYGLNKKYRRADDYYQKCWEYAVREEGDADNPALKTYFTFIGENCLIHRGRLFYEQKKYQESLDTYGEIPKVSYLWPYVLIEKAWAHYKNKNYNRALGLLATYKSPVMENYFFPEGDVLRALSYLKMCYWDDVKRIVDEYKVQADKSEQLKKILLQHQNSNTWFIKEAIKTIKRERREKHAFIDGLMTQIKKKVKFSRDMSAWIRLKKEIKSISKIPRGLIRKRLLKNLKNNFALRTKFVNHHVKKEMFNFLNDMNRYSQEILIINIEAASVARINFYSQKKKRSSKRIYGSFGNVKRSSVQQLYSFNGEFWADELGDYSFALKSKCQAEKKAKK